VPAGEAVGYARAWAARADSLVATLAIGYGDGVPRGYNGRVLLRGVSVPVVGRISMDQMAVLVDAVPDAAPGDVATLIGRDGGEEITVGEMAARCGTLTNEILSRLGRRVAWRRLP
jgi:alanine racemase